ncbi:uncharacterized protein LOC118468762 [Anopheles albimanus]|uniref:uncharacterized protein LOC118468762 n=1 Tax=Anopheles albimanus TaxID=7167 RepID=UPI00163E2B1C|nr:uncharacterized protein LOC118468762 [Anopheles albimanus]
MEFHDENVFLWQKLALTVRRDTSLAEISFALEAGVTFLYIQFQPYSWNVCERLLKRCKQAINRHAAVCAPWQDAKSIICELSALEPRLVFGNVGATMHLSEGHLITFTDDRRYGNQTFAEIMYVYNFELLIGAVQQGDCISVGDCVECVVERILKGYVTCRIAAGGYIEPYNIVKCLKIRTGPTSGGKSNHMAEITIKECQIALKHGFSGQTSAVLFNLDCSLEERPELICNADIISVDVREINKTKKYLSKANLAISRNSQGLIEPTTFCECLNFAAKTGDASAIILCPSTNIATALQLSSTDVHRPIFVLVLNEEQANEIMLRKYLIPISIATTGTTRQELISCAIEYGRRFRYLRSGSYVVIGFHDEMFGIELRYVPLESP